MNINTKILNKTLANQIQQHMKRPYNTIKLDSFQDERTVQYMQINKHNATQKDYSEGERK
jgi:hypothetical protein